MPPPFGSINSSLKKFRYENVTISNSMSCGADVKLELCHCEESYLKIVMHLPLLVVPLAAFVQVLFVQSAALDVKLTFCT